MIDIATVTVAITAGDLDDDLEALAVAMVERIRAEAIVIRWRMRFDGDEWNAETVTLGEMRFAEQHCHVVDEAGRTRKATYREIDPRVTSEHALALIIAHLHKAQGVPLGEATKRAETVTAAQLEEIVGEYQQARPPKEDATSPTPDGS